MNRDLFIIGCGGFGREVMGIARRLQEGQGWRLAGFVDDHPTEDSVRRVERLGANVVGPVSALAGGNAAAVVAVGSPQVRRSIVGRLAHADIEWPTLVHPDATIGMDVRLAEGVVIAAGARLSTNIDIERHVHVDQNATVGHDSRLAEFSRLNPQACVSGAVAVGEAVLIGASATVLPGVRVGAEAVVGAGSVVVRDVKEAMVVKGVPAR